METRVINRLRREWLVEANIELTQKRRRRYLHFDKVLTRVSSGVFRKVTEPSFVEKYAFFPLIRRSQINRVYKRDPLTKKKIIKRKERPISYAAHFDALIYSWYSYLINHYYEEQLELRGIGDAVIAYRRLGKSNIDFANEVFDFVKDKGECAVVAFDIEGFYDNLDPEILKSLWSAVLGVKRLPLDHYQVYRSVSKHAYVEWQTICKTLALGEHETEKIRLFLNINILEELRKRNAIEVVKSKGIPQGTPISCVLSNIYMMPFDIELKKLVDEKGGLYRRYSDDIIAVVRVADLEGLEKLVENQITKARLRIEPSKTERRLFSYRDDGLFECRDLEGNVTKLQYLGVEFDGQTYSLRHKGRAKFERKMVRAIRRAVAGAEEHKLPLARKGLYEKYSPMGKMNYISYVKRAAKGLNAKNIIRSFTVHRQHKKIKRRAEEERTSLKGSKKSK